MPCVCRFTYPVYLSTYSFEKQKIMAAPAVFSENDTSSMNDGDIITPIMTTTQQGRNRALAPAFIQKQMQQAVAVGAMTYVDGLEAMKLKQVYQKLFDSFHGNPTSGLLPMVNDLLTGGNAYAQLWDCSEDGQKTVRSRFTQKHDMLFNSGTHLTVSSLLTANQSTSVLADGRLLYSLAQNALKHGKKALSIETAAYVDGKLPSGWNEDDLDNHILDGMWRLLNNTPIVDAADDIDDNNDDAAANQEATSTPECPGLPLIWPSCCIWFKVFLV